MPEKYHIETKPVLPRLPRIGKHGIVDWREDCARCHNCVKKACVYDRYRQEEAYVRNLRKVDSLFFECMGCFSCVQNCTKNLLHLTVNSEYESMGNTYWRPEIILTNRMQAETAKIPVSGAGYKGKFSGQGFDSMWTDMSEIVRPTRDGIHGREYISTAVDMGRKLSFLSFTEDGKLAAAQPPLISLPMPVILDMSPTEFNFPNLTKIITETARNADIIAMFDSEAWLSEGHPYENMPNVALSFKAGAPFPSETLLNNTRLVEVHDDDKVIEKIKRIKGVNPNIITSIRVELNSGGPDRAAALAADDNVEVLHICASLNGNETGSDNPAFIKDILRKIHTSITENGHRDKVTLMAGGGIALPEHVVKALLCGADLVSINLPLMIAIECILCDNCQPDVFCPSRIEEVDEAYGTGRMTNLVGAWHDQIIELMGAMGIRDARRLRGDVGRALFFEELEEDTFGKLFGTRRNA